VFHVFIGLLPLAALLTAYSTQTHLCGNWLDCQRRRSRYYVIYSVVVSLILNVFCFLLQHTSTPVWKLAGLSSPPQPVYTSFTVSLGTPDDMGTQAAAAAAAKRPLLKLKLGGDAGVDIARLVSHKNTCFSLLVPL
jgi:hypothetical protein